MWPAIITVALIVVVYIVSFVLNKSTPAPIDRTLIDEAKCGACNNFSCAIKQEFTEEK